MVLDIYVTEFSLYQILKHNIYHIYKYILYIQIYIYIYSCVKSFFLCRLLSELEIFVDSNTKTYSKVTTSKDDNANVKYYARIGLKSQESKNIYKSCIGLQKYTSYR